ncbi:MAG: insulinase family protein [Verrucomicrobiia bacterium]
MNNRPQTSFVAFAAVLVSLTAADTSSLASPLAADPAIIRGRLDNGLRYVLMTNLQPKETVSLLFQVQAGSLEESDSQRGLARYLEHMAFCGTTNYPPGQLGPKLKQLGLRFSVLPYAIPGFDESVYKLDLPDAKPETIATGLGILADWAGGMLLLPEEIDREREGVLAELRHFNTPEARLRDAIAQASYAGTIVGERPPLVQPDSVTNANRTLLKNYYDTWYRPEAMMLMVVGAIDSQAVAAQVREKFCKLADRAPARPRPNLTTLSVSNQPAILVRHEPDAEGTEILVQRVMVAPPPDNRESERDELCRQLAERVFLRRIQTMVARDASLPLMNASVFSHDWLGFAHAGVRASVRQQSQAIQALDLAVTEYRRLLEYGPTDAELAVEHKTIAADLDAAVTQAGQRENPDLAEEIHRSTWEGRVIQSPDQRRDLLKPMLDTITRDEIIASLKAYRSRPGRDVVAVTGKEDLGADGEKIVRETYAKAMAAPVSAPAEKAVNTWAYGDLPQPSGMDWINERQDEADEGIKALWSHTHGIRVQARRSNATPGEVLVSLRFEINNGETKLQNRPAGVGELIERGLIPGGLGQHTADEVTALFADSSVRFKGVHVSDDAITYTATCNGNDLTRALQLLRAYYGDPGWRKEAEAKVKQTWLDSLAAQEHDVDTQVARGMAMALAGTNAWCRPATAAEVKAIGFADAQDWLNKALDGDILTVTVVGDAPTNTMEILTTWFAAYRVHARFMQASIDDTRATAMEQPPLKPGLERLMVNGPVAKAVVHVVWPTDDIYDMYRTHRLDLLARCLGARLQAALRQKFGAEATATAWSTASETFRGDGQIHELASVALDQADPALALIRAEATALAGQGIDDKLFEPVKDAALKSVVEKKQSNEWWFSTVLPYAGWQPFRMFWASGIEQDYQSITADQVSALAKKYLVDTNVFAVVGVNPGQSAAKPDQPGTGKVPQ